MIGRATMAGASVLAGLLLTAAGAVAQSAQDNANPPSSQSQAPSAQPLPPPGMFVYPMRPMPPPQPQQSEQDPQGCSYQQNTLELIV